jgi:3-oxoadipate enol-lactonase
MEITANGIKVHYTLDGPSAAPVVTLSHSLATDLSMRDPQMGALKSQFRVLRYDTRGHGRTEAPDGPYKLEQLAEDARALLQGLGIERTHFVGLSMGGMIGQVLALRHPEMLHSLTLCDTSSRVPPELRPLWGERIETARAQGMEPHVGPTIERWFTAPFIDRRPDVVDPVRTMIRATNPMGFIGCCHAIQSLDLTERLSDVSVPTLILVGEEDQGTPVAASQAILARFSGSVLVVLEAAAHLSNAEQPEAFNRAVMEFLEKVERGAARA